MSLAAGRNFPRVAAARTIGAVLTCAGILMIALLSRTR
jgi:ABC-type Fe3+-siderophore transport system permease subunit